MATKKITFTVEWVEEQLFLGVVYELWYTAKIQEISEDLCKTSDRWESNIIRYATKKVLDEEWNETEEIIEDLENCYIEKITEIDNPQTPQEFIREDFRVNYLQNRIMPIVTDINTSEAISEKQLEIDAIKEWVQKQVDATIVVWAEIE